MLGNFVVPCFFELVSVASCLKSNPGLFFYLQSTVYEKKFPVTYKKEKVDNLDTKYTSSTSSKHLPAGFKGEPEKSPMTSSQARATKYIAKSNALPRTKKKL